MTGFSLYETLRIFIPGGVAAAVVGVVLRLSSLGGQPVALAQAADEVAQGRTFFLLTLVFGFLLYAVDLPNKTRLAADGDPDNGVLLPSNVLREMLKDTPARAKSFSLYFFLTDSYLPPETHRRIYYFGGIHRIFADARFLLAAAVILGPQLVLYSSSTKSLLHYDFSLRAALLLLLVLAVLGVLGVAGELPHASASISKGRREPRQGRRRYIGRLFTALWRVKRAALVIASLGLISVALPHKSAPFLSVLGVCGSVLTLVLWGMIEVGPPRPPLTHRTDFRSGILRFLGLEDWTRSQYIPAQRFLFDMAAFVPSLVATSVGIAAQNVSLQWMLAWGALASLCVGIMAVRKHEIRLINNYQDQVSWLRLNETKIKRLGRADGFGPDQWS